MSKIYIRPYEPIDHDAVLNVFTVTAHDGLQKEGPEVLKYASYLWCRPYLMLEPESCFVLVERKVDDSGDTELPVGYIIGTPDTRGFVQKWHKEFIPYVEEKAGIQRYHHEQRSNLASELRNMIFTPDHLLHESTPSLIAEFPAHLHIDILASHQRHGYGRQLMTVFTHHLSSKGASGLHLTMSTDNVGADKFYAKLGFHKFQMITDTSDDELCMVLRI